MTEKQAKKRIKVNPPEKLLKMAYELFDKIKTQLEVGNIKGAEKNAEMGRWITTLGHIEHDAIARRQVRHKAETTKAGGAARGAQQRAEKKKRDARAQVEAEKLWKVDPTISKEAIAARLSDILGRSEDAIRRAVKTPPWVQEARHKKRR